MRTKQPPQENELKEACQSVKNDHPDFGVKRVFKELEQRKPRWRLTEKRVQKCMKKYGLTCKSTPPSPLRDDEETAPTVFPEDCVCLRTKPAQLGWVLKASGVLGGDDDYEDDDDEEEESRAVPEGSARVQWLDHYEPRLESSEALEVVDRPFVVGDVVARADDPTGALGAVVKVSLRADVRVVYSPTSVTVPPPPPPRNQRRRGRSAGRREPSPKPPPLPQKVEGTLRNIPAQSLKPATGLRMGDPVAHRTRGRWVGRVVGATYDVTVRCNGGALCIVQGLGDNGAEQLVEPVDDADYGFDELCPFFPGQRVSAPPSVWRRASWKNGARAPQGRRRRSGVVEKVEVSQAGVQWLAWGVGASRDPPPAWASVKEIDILAAFAGLTRVGDHVCGDGLPEGSCAQVIRTETRCSVRWSSSEDSPEVASLQLVPRQHLGEHDFLPNDFVVKRLEESSEVGVIRVVDAKERTCSVKFGDTEETMSSYELALSSADNYSAGDLVLRVNQSSSTEGPNRQTAGTVSDQTDFGTEDNEEAELAEAIRRSLEETPSTETPVEERWVGQVLSLSDGRVKVLWVDGSKEEVAPSELLLVPDASGEEPYDSAEESDGESLPTQGPIEAPVAQSPVVESEDDDSDDEDTSPFAIVEEPPQDHAYGHTAPHQVPLKQVRKLWAQLGKHLPPGVHVRAFEKRTDLLRAVIAGPQDTPYDGFLFWFDLQLPESYPSEPPAMHYHAWGLSERLNPNLYENGKVCLSLLGTWSGPGWDPESSTLLQLLVSVQGLVLVDKPYYNEPGHERHADTVEGEQQARLYNENARLLSLQATTAACRRPPRPFRGVVAAHFAKVGPALLESLEAAGGGDSHSDGYRRVLRRLAPRFAEAVNSLKRPDGELDEVDDA